MFGPQCGDKQMFDVKQNTVEVFIIVSRPARQREKILDLRNVCVTEAHTESALLRPLGTPNHDSWFFILVSCTFLKLFRHSPISPQ